jgi:hypothetical protein
VDLERVWVCMNVGVCQQRVVDTLNFSVLNMVRHQQQQSSVIRVWASASPVCVSRELLILSRYAGVLSNVQSSSKNLQVP